MKNDQDFLVLLQQQASKQARLERERVIPPSFDGLTAIIGKYSWQVIAVLSAVWAVIVTFASQLL
jgi:hypothetical protein